MVEARLLGAVGIVALVGVITGMVSAQTPDQPAFEVASIKPNNSGGRGSSGGIQPGGRFTVTNTTVFRMIANAYRVRDSQVVGGPSWITSYHFDVVAKANGSQAVDQRMLMLQSLLADRFSLRLHHETRELTEWKLVMARSDKRLGPSLHPASAADADCTVRGGLTSPFASADPFKALLPCSMIVGNGRLDMRGKTMDQIAGAFATSVGVNPIIVNRTDLEGVFNLDLEWTPETPQASPDAPPSPADGPSLFTAVQEQLGLKLVSSKGPVDVLVIDHAEHPTAD